MDKHIVQGDERAGWFINSSWPAFDKPEQITNRYRIIGARPARGNMGPAPILAPGLSVAYVRDSAYPYPDAKGGKAVRWSAYKDGGYLDIHTDVEAFEQVTESIPRPKVRAGIETRYYQGEWQKYSKRDGWVRING